MVIYRLTNKINGKKYIGQTIGNVKKRWTTHFAKSSGCVAINSALRKYGKANFIFEVVDSALAIEELNEKEEKWIEKENSLSPNGYNLTKGGNNRELSEEVKERIRESKRFEYEPIVCLDNGVRYDNISIAARDLDMHPNEINYVVHGKTDSANGMKFEFVDVELKIASENKRLARQKNTKEIRAKGQEIICLETSKIYPTIKAAAKDLGIRTCDFHFFFTGKYLTIKGYTFKYIVEEKNLRRTKTRNEIDSRRHLIGVNGGKATQKSILCIELNRRFDSISEASRELDICITAIGNMLAGRSKTSGGYTFKYL